VSKSVQCHLGTEGTQFGTRHTRLYSQGGIYIIDRDTMKTVDYLHKNFSGCINEIRLIDVYDECHPKGPLNPELLKSFRINSKKLINKYRLEQLQHLFREQPEYINKQIKRIGKKIFKMTL